jgi:two-component sensor histidine kinase
MALHELCTNAVKYGALSVEAGQVDIGWSVADGRFSFRWQETGGPPVARAVRKGFGSRLIERGMAAELDGEVRVDYEPAGVICAIDSPLPSG